MNTDYVALARQHSNGAIEDSQSAALEPSPKQSKQAHVRSRVSRACDRCKARKTRCSGKCPCAVCLQLQLDCRFTASYRRGKPPLIERDTSNVSPSPADGEAGFVQQTQDSVMPSPISQASRSCPSSHPRTGTSALQQPRARPGSGSAAHSSRNSPEPLQTDREGHLVGPASGVSFLIRVQRKLGKQTSCFSSSSSIFTFGDVPLPEFDSTFFILPPKGKAEALVDRYFGFAVATHRFLHRQTVEHWLDDLYTAGNRIPRDGARSRTALLFMIFAQTTQYVMRNADELEPESSARYFSAADQQLSEERGEVRLTSVQARLSQCFYLLSQSRINHCWSLFGTMAHLALALGLHRRRRIEPTGGVDLIEHECRKRTFWCAYNLDCYLSAALGRPRTFHDEDIDQDLPNCANDVDLSRNVLIGTNHRNHSEMAGPVAHIELSRILAKVLRKFYGLRPPSSEDRLSLAAKFTDELNRWKDQMPLLSSNGIDTSLLRPLFQRQRNVLNLAYWHTLLLVHRPFLLSSFASLSNYSTMRSSNSHHEAFEHNVQHCLQAAMQILAVVDELQSSKQLYRAFWFTYYFAFCAVVVLYVYTIRQRHSDPTNYIDYFKAATHCQEQITTSTTDGSLVQRYGMVLDELRHEVMRYNLYLREYMADAGAGRGGTTSTTISQIAESARMDRVIQSQAQVDHENGNLYSLADAAAAAEAGGTQSLATDPDQIPSFQIPGTSPTDSVVQMTGWGQFDSIVTGGLGGLETLLGQPNGSWTWV